MFKHILVIAIAFFTQQAVALTEAQLEPIRELGRLNGIALNCQYLKQAKHIKQALAQSLPKLRGLGEMFEEETNRSFLKFIQSGERCPGEATIEKTIQHAIDSMREQYDPPK